MSHENTRRSDESLTAYSSPQQDAGRSLQVSNAIASLHKQFVGRGPSNSRTTIDGNLVVCVLEGGFTQAEQTLAANDKQDLVAAERLGLQDAMRQALIAAVEQVTGRRVRAFMSANDLAHRLTAEIFVLAPLGPGGDQPDELALST